MNITNPAPTDAENGNIYSVLDGGTAHITFDGLAGTTVEQYVDYFNDPEWIPLNVDSGNVIQGPWVRTVDGQIRPSVETMT